MTRRPSQPGFTLIEVVISLAVSAVLFVGVSRILSASLSYSHDITGLIRFRQEQQRIYLGLRNALSEADKLMFAGAAPNPRLVLRNKSNSSLRPFTVIENPATTNGVADNRLLIQDFTIDPFVSTSNPTTAARQDKPVTTSGRTMVLKPTTNQVIIGNPALGSPANGPCTATFTNCILFNYKNNKLDFGVTGYAPFVGAPLITDIRVNLPAEPDFIYVLSPYEKREYKIRVNGGVPSVSFTTLSSNGEFPYFYVGNTPTTPAFGPGTSMADTPPSTKPFQVTNFIRTAAGAGPQIDVLTMTLTDLGNLARTATITLLFPTK